MCKSGYNDIFIRPNFSVFIKQKNCMYVKADEWNSLTIHNTFPTIAVTYMRIYSYSECTRSDPIWILMQ